MKIYFSSDWHLNHYNIIRYCNRPFKTLEEMNNTIISRFNERVKEDDMFFFLGDFCFKSGTNRGQGEPDKAEKFLKQLKCKNKIFIAGNHDVKGRNSLRTPIQSIVINHGGKDIFLTHYPEKANPRYEINLVGHSHGTFGKVRELPNGSVIVDMSVENWDYYPVTINEILHAIAIFKKNKRRI